MFRRALLAAAIATNGTATASLAPVTLCRPQTGLDVRLVTAAERKAAAKNIKPPLIDIFAWPDGPFGVLRSGSQYAFFATDGGTHRNGKAGSMTVTFGPLDQPLGSAPPIDVTIENDLRLNPKHHAYDYIGGGPVYLVPAGLPGAGNLLTVYHAERNTTGPGGFYSLLGLARSTDGARSWHDLGEIVEVNQRYRPNLGGFDLGISQLVIDPTGSYFYVYFPDWLANGSLNPTKVTVMSVARVPIVPLLSAAFAAQPTPLPPFAKWYRGTWSEPGINGRSTDLEPGSYPGDPSVVYSAYLKRYVVVADDTQKISYGESADGVTWTPRTILHRQPSAIYARPVATAGDPNVLGQSFNVYYTFRNDWTTATVDRFTVTCR
jgi:hypothetical protein